MPIIEATNSDLPITPRTLTAMSSIFWWMVTIEWVSLLEETSGLGRSYCMTMGVHSCPTGTMNDRNAVVWRFDIHGMCLCSHGSQMTLTDP